MKRLLTCKSVWCILGLMLGCQTATAGTLITYVGTGAGVENGVNQVYQLNHDAPSGTAIASLPGYSSLTTASYATFGDSATFSAAFDLVRGGDAPSRLIGNQSEGDSVVHFTPSANVSYSISGNFTGSGGYASLQGYIYDITESYFYFIYYNAYSLSNNLSYTGTGTLWGGHDYYWASAAWIVGNGGDSGATASASTSFSLAAADGPGDGPNGGGPASAPEPASLSLLCLGIAGMVGYGWRKRKLVAA
jgi:hypothetical protein